MNEIYWLILIFATGLIAPILDIHSTKQAMKNPRAYEKNKWFRNPDGSANIGKLILFNAVYFGVAMVVSVILWHFGAGLLPVVLFFYIATLIRIPTILKNYKVAGNA